MEWVWVSSLVSGLAVRWVGFQERYVFEEREEKI
ncbi:hypothetical protein CCACVL1_30577 [Corchorus capsularis]|uniref:Uncharacterized protein n=1 Tax=Corchorus capsularis TaxID=210143 RepID=A0A1R3FWQ6_COCAP|nr:hypothetical protein CCACVL1_30577 [Corchorus capsularis]